MRRLIAVIIRQLKGYDPVLHRVISVGIDGEVNPGKYPLSQLTDDINVFEEENAVLYRLKEQAEEDIVEFKKKFIEFNNAHFFITYDVI